MMINRVAVLAAFVGTMCATFDSLDGLVMSGFGFDVGALLRTQRSNFLDGFGFFDGVVGDFDFVDDVDFFNFLFVVLFVLIECRTADDGVRGCVSLHFILFCVDDARCERCDFIIAQRGFGSDFVAITFEFVSRCAIFGRRGRIFGRA